MKSVLFSLAALTVFSKSNDYSDFEKLTNLYDAERDVLRGPGKLTNFLNQFAEDFKFCDNKDRCQDKAEWREMLGSAQGKYKDVHYQIGEFHRAGDYLSVQCMLELQQKDGCINVMTALDKIYYDESGKIKKMVSENKDKKVKCPSKDTKKLPEKVGDKHSERMPAKKYKKAPKHSPKIAEKKEKKEKSFDDDKNGKKKKHDHVSKKAGKRWTKDEKIRDFYRSMVECRYNREKLQDFKDKLGKNGHFCRKRDEDGKTECFDRDYATQKMRDGPVERKKEFLGERYVIKSDKNGILAVECKLRFRDISTQCEMDYVLEDEFVFDADGKVNRYEAKSAKMEKDEASCRKYRD